MKPAPALPRPRRLALLGLIAVLGLACAVLPTPADRSDPRESNRWFAAGREAVAQSARFVEGERPAKNVIFFVGDGRDLTIEWVKAREGPVYVWNREEFESIDLTTTRHRLGPQLARRW